MGSASWLAAALAASLAAAAAGVGCQGILGIQEPRDSQSDAAGSAMPDASAQPIDVGPAGNPNATWDGDLEAAEDGNVDASESGGLDASESGDLDAPDEGSENMGLDALASPDADAEAGPAPNPCAKISGITNGDYCGSDSQFSFDTTQADPNTLYVCSNGSTLSAVVCPHGCQTNVATDDSCNP